MAPETPKGISSRLLTMKFMQRAVASSTTTPSPDPDSHSAKKRKLGHAASDKELLGFDQSAVQAAIEDRETKRQEAILKHRTDDTRWVVNTAWDKKTSGKTNTKPLRVVYVGYGDVDADKAGSDDDDLEDDATAVGRMSTYKKPKEPATKVSTCYMLAQRNKANFHTRKTKRRSVRARLKTATLPMALPASLTKTARMRTIAKTIARMTTQRPTAAHMEMLLLPTGCASAQNQGKGARVIRRKNSAINGSRRM